MLIIIIFLNEDNEVIFLNFCTYTQKQIDITQVIY